MSFSDGFKDLSKVNAAQSSGYFFDPRELVCNSRSRGDTHFTSEFDAIEPYWAESHGGTASVSIVTPPHGDYAIGNVLQLQTGATLNSLCMVSRTVAGIGSSFGVMLHHLLNVGHNLQDCLVVKVTNDAGVMLELLLVNGSILLHMDDGYQLLSPHCPDYFCESWFEVAPSSNGRHQVTIYQGTEQNGQLVGIMPTGSPGSVVIQQNSGANNNRMSQIGRIGIGITQLADDMTITGVDFTAPFLASAANLHLRWEDVSNNATPNTNIKAQLKINGVWIDAPLVELPCRHHGIIDYTKKVRELFCNLPVSIQVGAVLAYRVSVNGGRFGALTNAAVQLTSIY